MQQRNRPEAAGNRTRAVTEPGAAGTRLADARALAERFQTVADRAFERFRAASSAQFLEQGAQETGQ